MSYRLYFAITLIIVAIFAFLIFLISQFLQPLLPPNLNNLVLLFVASVLGALGVLASLNEITELVHKLHPSKDGEIHKNPRQLITPQLEPVFQTDTKTVKLGSDILTKNAVLIPIDQLRKPTLVLGMSGSGKSETISHIIEELWHKHKIPFLGIDIDYGAGDFSFVARRTPPVEPLIVLAGQNDVSFTINPFICSEDHTVTQHCLGLLGCFKSALNLEDDLTRMIQNALVDCYKLVGLRPDTNLVHC